MYYRQKNENPKNIVCAVNNFVANTTVDQLEFSTYIKK